MERARNDLQRQFREVFDRSLAEQLLEKFRRNFPKPLPALTPIGEGRHFRAFRIAGSGPMSLTLNIANDEYMRANAGAKAGAWLKNMDTLRSSALPLIPPFEVIRGEDSLGLVLPYGAQAVSRQEMKSEPLAGQLNELVSGLQKVKLQIDDYLQVHAWEGQPFICDFSDLRSI